MDYRLLGTSDLKISTIGFGCMSLGDDYETILHQAIAHGINFFDTADLYQRGVNEEWLGKALKHKRRDVVIATKVGNQWRADGTGWDWNPNKEYILQSVEGSLKRLQTDYIDLYQLHGGTIDDPIDDTIAAFEQLKQQGKIRYYGISSIRPNVIREYIKRSTIVSVMMQYSLLDRRPEETCLQQLQENNIGVLARGSIAQGLLVNKPPKEYLNYTKEEVAKAQLHSAHKAIQFVLKHPAVTSAIAGIRTMQQLEEAAALSPLSNDAYQQIQSILPPNKYEQHR